MGAERSSGGSNPSSSAKFRVYISRENIEVDEMDIRVVDVTDILMKKAKLHEHIFPGYSCAKKRNIDFSKTISWSMCHAFCSVCGKKVYLPC